VPINSDHSLTSDLFGVPVPDGTGASGSGNPDAIVSQPSGLTNNGDFASGVSDSARAGSISIPFGVGSHGAPSDVTNGGFGLSGHSFPGGNSGSSYTDTGTGAGSIRPKISGPNPTSAE
jgi:hypothetical protein